MANATGTVQVHSTHQMIEGFGAASTAWYHAPETSDAGFYDLIVNDLGASGARGAVSPNFEVANDNDDPNVFDWSGYDSSSLGHVLQFNQRLQERGASQFFLTVWTPPWWMKTNQSNINGGSLRYDMRAEFAEYVAALVIVAKRDFNIDVAAVSVQNEQFFVEPYESGIADNTMMRDTTIAVQQKLAREGLGTKVIANEDLDVSFAGTRWKWFNDALLEDDQVDKSKLVIGVHATDSDRMPAQATALAGTGVPLWYTEISGHPANWTGAMDTARDMSDILTKANATSYYYWLYGYPAWGDTAAIISDGVPNPKYHALKHFYKYVRPGMQRLGTSIDESGGLRLSAFRDPGTGAMTIVLVNDGNATSNVSVNLGGLTSASSFRGFRSGENSYWQSLGTLGAGSISGNGTGGALDVTLAGRSVVTLTTLADSTPISGSGSVEKSIPHLFDANTGSQLRKAAADGDLALVNTLIAQGVDVNAGGPGGWTPLHAAVSGPYATCEAITAALIEAGADVDAVTGEGFTPLHVVAMNGFADYRADYLAKANIVTRLVTAGADVNARDDAGRTPLMWSTLTPSANGPGGYNPWLAYTLTARGADRTLLDDGGMTAYDHAMAESRPGIAGFVSGAGLDTRAPVARHVAYSRDRNVVSLSITEDVAATLTAADVRVTDRATNLDVGGWTFTRRFSNGLTFGELTFAGRLPDGRYRVSIDAGAFADQSGLASTNAIALDFTSLGGDASGDGKVDFDDLLVMAQNYGKSGRTFSSGDFNGDGIVDFDDLLTLAQRYGTTLLEIGPPQVAVAKRPRRA